MTLIEDRIKEWREDDDEGYNSAIEVLCEAEEELRCLRARIRELEQPNWPDPEGFEYDKGVLNRIGIRYSESFMEIDQGEDGSEADRLWRWMAKLINDCYQVGVRSTCGVKRGPR